MFYISWSHEASYVPYDEIEDPCSVCNKITKTQIRVYEDKTKLYGAATIGVKRFVTAVCRECLTEFKVEKMFEKKCLIKYQADMKLRKLEEKEAKRLRKETKA